MPFVGRAFCQAALSTALLLWLPGCGGKEEVADQQVNPATVRTLTPREQVRELTGALAQQPTSVPLLLRRARLCLEIGDGPAALADAEQILKLDGAKAPNHLLHAQALRAVGKVREAQQAAALAEQAGYEGAELPLLQGELHYILREYQAAITDLNKALAKSQFEQRAYYYKGMVYAEIGDTARAISTLQTAVEQAPDFADAINQLAAIYNAKKDYKTARQYLLGGIRMKPDDGFFYYNLGSTTLLEKRPDSALKLFEQAARLDTTLYLAQYNAAILHYDRGEYAPVVKYMRAVLRRTDRLPNSRLVLADAADRVGDARTAVREYGILTQKDPADTRLTFRLYQAKVRLRQQQADSLAGREPRAVRLDSLRKVR